MGNHDRHHPGTNSVPEMTMDELLDTANAICGRLLAMKPETEEVIPYPLELTARITDRYLEGAVLRLFHITGGPDPSSTTVYRSEGSYGLKARGSRRKTYAERLMELIPGRREVWFSTNPGTIAVTASRLKAKGLATFKVEPSEDDPTTVAITRVDRIIVVDGYGKEIDLGRVKERTPYPFRTMKPGDRFGIPRTKGVSMATMRSTCSRFSQITGYVFTPTKDRDGNIIVACTYRPGVWVSDKRKAEVEHALINIEPQWF